MNNISFLSSRMSIFTRILDFYLILLFFVGESEFQHPGDKIYVSKPPYYYSLKHPSSNESRRNLSFSHNVVKDVKMDNLGTPEILNLSFTSELIAASPTHVPQPVSPLKFPQTREMTRSLPKEKSPGEPSVAPAEYQQVIHSLLNTSPVLKLNTVDHRTQHEKRAGFPPLALRMTSGCGGEVDGVFDVSNTNLSEKELREKMNPRRCRTILDKITEVNISHNHLQMDLRILIKLLLKIKNVHSIDVSYNKINRKMVNIKRICFLKKGNLLFLNLSHNPLTTLKNLCLPSSLKSIDLSFTGISRIPKQFALHLIHLEVMSVQGNNFIYSPSTLSDRHKKKPSHLRISYINVSNQPPIENLPTKLQHLIMSNCLIVELPEWFATKLGKLVFLDLSNNPMHKFPQLPNSLHRLDLSNSNLQMIAELQHCSDLTQFKIANNKIQSFLPTYLPVSLKEFDISINKLHTFPYLGTLQKLESLNVSGNLIMQLNLNRSSPLANLDASRNVITELPDHTAKFLPELKYLNLSENKISFLQPGSLPKSLLELDISDNAITIIVKETFGQLANLNILTVQGKHFFCNCDLYWFASIYLSSPHLQINGREGLLCSFPPQKRGLLVENSNLTVLYCSLSLQVSITACTAILVMSILMVLFWRFHGPWYIKMGWYWCMAKRKQYEKRPEHKLYDAFISYSETDGPWTKGTLLEKLEANGFKVCYHERDFRPGHPVLGNIFYCIENSHKVLFVLSPGFVNSCWCQYELYFAEHRVLNENQDSLIMVVLEDLPLNSIPQKFSKLRKLLKRKTYLKWSPEEHKQKLFWRQLTAVLRTTNEPIVLMEENGTHQRNPEDTCEVVVT
uniref:TIR domain-containing protein n=1 Tax=Salvator merianae TaxID=96440 RepID=A0A8D0DRC6_SALMN